MSTIAQRRYEALSNFRPSTTTEGSYPGDSGSRLWEYWSLDGSTVIELARGGMARLRGAGEVLDREQLSGLGSALSTMQSDAAMFGREELVTEARAALAEVYAAVDAHDGRTSVLASS